jgi:hypothetical protein
VTHPAAGAPAELPVQTATITWLPTGTPPEATVSESEAAEEPTLADPTSLTKVTAT